MNFFAYIQKMDKVLAGAAILLTLFGVVELVAMAYGNHVMAAYQYKQLIALGIGIVLMVALSFLDYRFFKNNSYAVMLLYVGSVLALVVLLLVGKQTRGLTGWFTIGGFAFAPVETTKIVLALLFAKYFSLRHVEMYRWFHVIISFSYVAVPMALVLLQPDLGSAVVVFSLWLGIVLFSGISRKQIALLIILGMVMAWGGWAYALKDYQKERIVSFVNPYHDPQGVGYNAIQAMIAVGSGGMFGKGLGYGSQVQLGFLPEAHTDFMFASIVEEFGLFGAMIVLLLLSIIVWRIMRIGLAAENNFARIFCAAMMVLIFIHVAINLGMNVGLMPVIGIAFPFLSYGGSNLLALFIGLGLVQSIHVRG
ncbi:MAG: rod shape-determining protein RodA [Candidatus Azambacteria bacterium]|nr:rod shape-determining protein RodA [Candidatus Azambacteria bacterium]